MTSQIPAPPSPPQPFHRHIFTANRLLGRQPQPQSHSSSNDSPNDEETNTRVMVQSHGHGLTAMFLPHTWSEIEPSTAGSASIVAVASNHLKQFHRGPLSIDLIYADASDRLYLSRPNKIGVSTFLIEQGLQQTYYPGSVSRTIHVHEMDLRQHRPPKKTINGTGAAEPVRGEDLCLFRCREAILDLRFSCRRENVRVGDEWYSIGAVDLIHARSITRVEYRMTRWSGYEIPHVVSIRTILSLPSDSPPMISNVPFPFFTNGYGIEVGPYLITLKDSPHIWLMRPGENKPQVIVNENDFKVVIEKAGFPISSESSSESSPQSLTPAAPILSASSIKDFHFIWVLSYGYIFRVTFCPFKLLMTELTITVGVSPHTTNHDMNESTPRPFFRFNSYDYRLQEMDQRLYVLDCVEGCISQFQTNGQLEQCIQPAPPIGMEIQLPLKNYCLNDSDSPDRGVSNFFLIDSSPSSSHSPTIYHWTSSYQQQCQYTFGGGHRLREILTPDDRPYYSILVLPLEERLPAEPIRKPPPPPVPVKPAIAIQPPPPPSTDANDVD